MASNGKGAIDFPHNPATGGVAHLAIPGFLREVRKYGRFDVNACLNCGTCTVACDLATDSSQFPRRTMRYASIGLRDELQASLEPWLCHDCRDCSRLCVREADPGESMATLRRYLASTYDITGLTARMFRSRAWEIGALASAAVAVLGLAWGYHAWKSGLSTADLFSTPMGMEHMFPMIIWFTLAVFLIPALFLGMATLRMHKLTMRGRGIPLSAYAAELGWLVINLVVQPRMRECHEQKDRRWRPHWMLGASFVLMSIILIFFLRWFQTDSILPVWHPQRWLGYLIAAAMVIVPAQVLLQRRRGDEEFHKFTEGEDVALPLLLLLTAVSGIAVHILRYAGLGLTCHFAYAIHLAIAVPLVVIELPFGKLAHAWYRPLAMYFQAVKERAVAGSRATDRPAVAIPEAGAA